MRQWQCLARRPLAQPANPLPCAPAPGLQAEELQQQVDGLYRSAFEGLQWPAVEEGVEAPWGPGEPPDLSDMSEARFGELGRTSPQVGGKGVVLGKGVKSCGWRDAVCAHCVHV